MTIAQNESLYPIAKDLSNKLGQTLGIRVYLAIAANNGTIVHIDSELEPYASLINTFVKYNFHLAREDALINNGDKTEQRTNKLR